MPIKGDPAFIGRAWITPEAPVVAGESGTWTITYEVGAYGYDERARLKIASRFASDWGTPQFTDPTGRNYTTDHADPAPPRGACHAYWIRATQEDGAQAWTSPVYLDA